MPKFLNTSATTYHLEELIKSASERLILISPFLRINERIRELLEDKNRMKIDIRIIYGKNELQPDEMNWLKSLDFVRISFCKNLHAKCYLSESAAIITSMNLYEFSQVNNNEMGVFIQRDSDGSLYMETYQEAQRLVRVSEEIKISVEKIHPAEEPGPAATKAKETSPAQGDAGLSAPGKCVSTTQLAKDRGIPPKELFAKLQSAGWISRDGEAWKLTDEGKKRGGEIKRSPQYGDYIVWPSSTVLPQ